MGAAPAGAPAGAPPTAAVGSGGGPGADAPSKHVDAFAASAGACAGLRERADATLVRPAGEECGADFALADLTRCEARIPPRHVGSVSSQRVTSERAGPLADQHVAPTRAPRPLVQVSLLSSSTALWMRGLRGCVVKAVPVAGAIYISDCEQVAHRHLGTPLRPVAHRRPILVILTHAIRADDLCPRRPSDPHSHLQPVRCLRACRVAPNPRALP